MPWSFVGWLNSREGPISKNSQITQVDMIEKEKLKGGQKENSKFDGWDIEGKESGYGSIWGGYMIKMHDTKCTEENTNTIFQENL